MNNINELNKKIIPPVGLINLSRIDKKKKLYYLKENEYNIYNVCYINSSIQCLLHLDEFVNKILICNSGKLIKAIKELIIDMIENKKNYFSVSKIKKAMGEINKQYEENEEEDANEFISDFLDELIEETENTTITSKIIKNIHIYDKMDWMKKNLEDFLDKFYNKKGNSFILDLFYGILKTTKYCKICENIISIKFNAYNILELPIYDIEATYKNKNSALNMKDILNKYISENITSSSCEKCNEPIYYKTEIYSMPKCLIIYFARDNGNRYIENDILLLPNFDFKDYISLDNPINYKYNLKAVIYHEFFGNNIGHYSCSCLNNNMWYYFDDNFVKEEKKAFINGKPIILFYEN